MTTACTGVYLRAQFRTKGKTSTSRLWTFRTWTVTYHGILRTAFYISQLVRYARICSRKDDFIYRHRRLSLKLQQQGYKFQQLMKLFHKFYRSHSDELKKFGTTLIELRSSIWKEVLVEHILLNYILTYFWCVRGYVFIFFHCLMCYLLRAHFPFFLFACAFNISLCCILTLDAYFILTVIILFSLPILTFVQTELT